MKYSAVALLLLTCQALGQTSPGFLSGQVLTAPELNSAFQFKNDYPPPNPDQLRARCYIADGVSHPLSSVTSCNGGNTTGFTLTQWQAILPAAAALTDEVDWAAIQSIMNVAAGPIAIRFPPGIAILNKPIAICNQSVSIFGSGSRSDNAASVGTSTLRFTGGTDGITHCPGASTVVQAQDILLQSTTLGGAIYGIKDQSANYTYLRNVFIQEFNNGALFNNPGGIRLLSVFMNNGQAAGVDTTSTGVLMTGHGFVNHISDTLVQGFATGYNFNSTPAPIGLEDIQVFNSACGGVWKCINIGSTDPSYGPFNYSFINMSVDAVGSFMFAAECNDVIVSGGNWLSNAPVGSWTGGGNMFDIGTGSSFCHGVRLRDLWLSQVTTTRVSLITAENDEVDLIMDGLHIETAGATMTSGWFQVAPGATEVIERNTQWTSNFSPIRPPSNAVANASPSTTNKLQSVILGVPTLSACGTSPTVGSGATGEQGTIITGTGNPTGCTITFPLPNRAVAPSCIVVGRSMQILTTTISTASIVWTNAATNSQFVDYKCTPY